MRILQTDNSTKEDAAKVIAFASKEENIIDKHKATLIVAGDIEPPGMNPEFVIHIHDGYRVVYTREQHKELCHHLSISVEDTDKCPNPHAVNTVLGIFGMRDFEDSVLVWVDDENAINILQEVNHDSKLDKK